MDGDGDGMAMAIVTRMGMEMTDGGWDGSWMTNSYRIILYPHVANPTTMPSAPKANIQAGTSAWLVTPPEVYMAYMAASGAIALA